jgi:ABC-type Fe3+/spermidine/putrescine transport system ATPase subunit
MITLDRIGIKLDDFSLDDITLTVEDGEFFILLGPSGVGKTALLEAVAGLNPVRRGRTLLDGRDVTALPPEARPIAYVPQDASLFPHLRRAACRRKGGGLCSASLWNRCKSTHCWIGAPSG